MNAIQQLLTEHIAIWTDADTEKKSGRGRSSGNAASVYGIRKLRELILELAVRGKLVPQDANDEPASALLKRIQAEKTKLIAEGKIKKDKPLPLITEDEKPFELPQGWECVRNGVLFSLRKGRIPKNLSEDNIGLPYLDIEALNRGVIRRYSNDDKCPQSTDSDILVVCDGSRSGLVLNGKIGIIGSTLSIIDTPVFIQPFVRLIFKQGYERLNSTMKGAAIPHLDTPNLVLEVTGFPPLAEQHRIVAKVDELMALCDQLETRHNAAAEAHEKLVSHLLGTLTQPPVRPELVEGRGSTGSPRAEFEENWQRIAAHFDTLFTTEASIDALKQTLLQLAVMGKLVPQDPNDEPASTLLKRIQAEKAKLIAEGKIKKDKPLALITDEEKPFELPQGWEWVRLGDLVEKSGAGWSPNCENHPRVGNDWGVLKVSAVTWGKFQPEENKALPNNLDARLDCVVETGDFLVSRANTAELVARSVVVESCPPNLMLSDKIVRLQFSSFCDTRFINIVNSSSFARSYYSLVAGGTSSSMKNVTREQILNLIIGKPPLAEQHRIVAKVDELMALCDQLKTRLTAANQLQQKLADVVVEQAIA